MSQPKTVDFLKAALPDVELRPLPKRIKKKVPIHRSSDEETNINTAFNALHNPDEYVTFEPIEEDFDFQIPLGCLYGLMRPDLQSFTDKTRPYQLPAEVINAYAERFSARSQAARRPASASPGKAERSRPEMPASS